SVSVIGLGDMGSGLARTLIEAGYRVSVWNRSRDKVDAIATLGGIACNNPKEAIQANTHVVVCVSDYSVWNRIIEDQDLHLEFKSKCIIQLTGGTFDEVQEHAAFIESNGGRIADGAIMCFPRQLGTADASLLMSGAPAVLDDCAGLFETLAPDWTNLGEDVRKPSILSRALVAGILTSFVGFMNGMAVCRASGISLDVYKELANKANAFVPA
ncbi:MAG: NAD(P)-binding domain-containing protein, partial [Planctomycetota bacterium]|nr:NAD(P)-binding domain-containing protein [Planctomycetota bacterium]